MQSIAILGAGTWGTALAALLAGNGKRVAVWSALPEEVETFSSARYHPYLDIAIPPSIVYTASMEEACGGKDVILFAVPSVFVRETARKAAPFLREGQIVVDVAKGIERETLLTLSGVISDEFEKAGKSGISPVALTGPTHAEEVARRMPTVIVAAGRDPAAVEAVRAFFSCDCLRVYPSSDVSGAELCGALKNIIALASGVSSGLGYGDNTRAAIITRGMAEIARLGRAMGCDEDTFSGPAGIGDLIVTATSEHSRNFRAGVLLGRGKTVEEALSEVGMVVEGVNALPAALALAEKYEVDLPIAFAVDAVVNRSADPRAMVLDLMKLGRNAFRKERKTRLNG